MKRVGIVSLGPKGHDKGFETEFLGQKVAVEWHGTDGNMRVAQEVLKGLDGKVDVIGLDSMNRAFHVSGRDYPVEEIQRGIQHGVRKINVDTDNRMAITGAIRKVLTENPAEFDPRAYLKPARAAMKQVCIDRMTAFGQAGNASKIRQLEAV